MGIRPDLGITKKFMERTKIYTAKCFDFFEKVLSEQLNKDNNVVKIVSKLKSSIRDRIEIVSVD